MTTKPDAAPGGHASSSAPLTGRDLAAALCVVLVWGMNFVAMKVALRDFTPFQLGAVRYAFAALPLVLFVRRPQLPAPWLIGYGFVQGVGQFGLLFVALKVGMTAALASVVMQTQLFFTAIFAWLLLHERIAAPLRAGLALAALGLGCFALNFFAGGATGGITVPGLALNLGAASMWGTLNIITRKAQQAHPGYDAFQLVVWGSLVPIGPFIAMSLLFDAPAARWQWLHAGFDAWACAAYLGWIATVLAYTTWTGLFKRHPANRVAPFSLGVPLVGIAAGTGLLGEAVTRWQWAGIGFVVAALAAVMFGPRLVRRRPSALRTPA